MHILRPLLILSFALPAFAQEPAAKPAAAPASAPVAAPAAAPAPAPAVVPAAPVPAGAPGAPLLPPPATAPAEIPLGPFKDIKERHSYGLGIFLGNREKNNAAANPDKPTLNSAEILQGLQEGLSGAKSLDYTAGLAMAAQIKRSGVEIDNAVLADAVRAALENKDAKIQANEVQTIMQEIQNGIQQRQMAKQKEEAEKNLAVSNAFLAENGKKEGVKTSPSGLQYKIEAPGEGNPPGAKDLVTINIHGTNIEGADFDKSNPGTPARRSLAALPKGLQEGILMLKPGGKGSFWVPPALGYGEAARGAALKGNSVLHYEVELVSSEVPPPPPAQPAGAPGVIPGAPRRPVSAVTPPVSVDIPASPGKPVSAPVQVPPPAPPPVKPGAATPPPAPAPAVPPPAPAAPAPAK